MTEVNQTPGGTIDITNLVESTRSTWVTWATNIIYAAIIAVPFMTWVAWPGISTLARGGIEWVMNFLSKTAVMGAFYLNTAIRKASQAADYVDTVTAKNALPPTASNEEYKNAEIAEVNAFTDFVVLSN